MTKLACESTFHVSPVLVDVTVFELGNPRENGSCGASPPAICDETTLQTDFLRMAIIRSYDLSARREHVWCFRIMTVATRQQLLRQDDRA